MTQENKKDMITVRTREATLSNFDSEKRTARLSFASETPVIDNWGDKEILRVSDESMDIQRFQKNIMPMLFNHYRDRIIGRIDNIFIENKKAYADITFDEDEDSKIIMKKVESGSLRGVSVGYKVKEYEVIKSGSKSVDGIEGPAYIVTKWEVIELSIASVPADPEVGVGRQYGDEQQTTRINTENESEDNNMSEVTASTVVNNVQVEAEEKQRQVQENVIREKALKGERERVNCIRAMATNFNIDNPTIERYINEGLDINTVNREVLEIISKRNQAVSVVDVSVGATAGDKVRALYIDGLTMRGGINIEHPAEGAKEKGAHRTLREIAIDVLATCDGQRAEELMSIDVNQLHQRAMTSDSFLSIMSNVANKSMSSGYDEAGTSYKLWTKVGNLTDFKETKRYRISAAEEPVEIKQGGEFTFAELSDEGVSISLQTVGKGYTFTRQMFINDDIGVITSLSSKFVSGFERLKNRLAYEALSTITYDKTNKNLAIAGIPSEATLTEMRRLLKKQVGVDNKTRLNLVPGGIIVPTTYETIASKLIFSPTDIAANNPGVKNVFYNAFGIICDATLDDISEDAWFMYAKPNMVDGIEIAYLNGVERPIIETQVDFNSLGMRVRMYHDFRIKALDHRGFVKNAGK